MASVTAPVDGRRQYSLAVAAMANYSLGGMPWAGMEQVGPDAYVARNSWPTPPPTPSAAGFSSLAAASATSNAAPKSASAALWPNLK